MKKVFLVVILFLLVSGICFAWGKKQKPLLYFGNSLEEIEKSILNSSDKNNVFLTGNKIFFLVYTPFGFKSDYIKYQIVKQDAKIYPLSVPSLEFRRKSVKIVLAEFARKGKRP